MLIGGVSSMASTAVVLNPAIASRTSSDPSSAATVTPAAAQSPSSPNPSAGGSSGTSAPGRVAAGADAHRAAAPAASSSTTAEVQVSTYPMSVAGNQYWGSVEESGGEYSASVPNVAGATASGLTEQEAESNLEARVDELV